MSGGDPSLVSDQTIHTGPGVVRRAAGIVQSKFEHAVRLLLVHYLSRYIPLVLVTEYPKSGGTWLGQLISGYLGIPFPRNRVPTPQRCLLHGHYRPSQHLSHIPGIVWLARDGRDVMVSLYHQYLLWNDRNRLQPSAVLRYRKQLAFADYHDVRGNLPAFIGFVFTYAPSKLQHFTHPGTWASFNRAWLEQDCVPPASVLPTRYEALAAQPEQELTRVLGRLDSDPVASAKVAQVVAQYSFEAQTGRVPGEERTSSFLRKGSVGDWRNFFNREAAEVFDHYAGDMLVTLGYEPDRGWVRRV